MRMAAKLLSKNFFMLVVIEGVVEVVAKIYALIQLMLIEEINGLTKYSSLAAIHIIILTFFNYLTDSSHLQNNITMSKGDRYSKRCGGAYKSR